MLNKFNFAWPKYSLQAYSSSNFLLKSVGPGIEAKLGKLYTFHSADF